MSAVNNNFIAGEWLAGESEIANINPSDLSDTIGLYAQADSSQLHAMAFKTYAPATAESRAGAGAGLTDND